MNPEQEAIKSTLWSVVSSIALILVKGIAGIFGNSFALVADAVESFTDVLSSLLLLMGYHYARRPADENHPYGHGKVEPLVTFMVVIILVFAAVGIGWRAVLNMQGDESAPELWTLLVVGLVVVWKELTYRYLDRKGKRLHSSSLRAEAKHQRSDGISSLAAFIGIGIAVFLGPGYEDADEWAALLAAVIILYNAYQIFRPALGEIMDEHLYDELVEEIRLIADEVPGVLGTEKCFVRKAGMRYLVDLHAIVDGKISVVEGHEISHQLKDELMNRIPQLENVLIHIEPNTYTLEH